MTVRSDKNQLERTLCADGHTAIEALDRNVIRFPEKCAVRYGDGGYQISYAEFGRQTDSIAGNLAAQGIRNGDRISVLTRSPVTALLWMYGIWKAGAVYSPVNHAYEGTLLSYQLNDTDPALLLVSEELAHRVSDIVEDLNVRPHLVIEGGDSVDGFRCLDYDSMTAEAARPSTVLSEFDPANVIYTSGTTGPSKGVLQSHRWVNQYTYALRAVVDADDVIYNDLPMYHVGGAMANAVRALWVGATVAMWDRFSPNDFWRRIEDAGVTTAILLDVMIPWLTNSPVSERDADNSLAKVHMQPLPASHREFAQRFGIEVVTCGFGQTESGAPLSALILESEPRTDTASGRRKGRSTAECLRIAHDLGQRVIGPTEAAPKAFMGGPGAFSEVTVLDGDDRECPPGQAGELAVRVRLDGLIFDEYIGKPDATAHAMRGGWFHTGDAAVREADGSFRFVDRIGDRIRVRGENISSFHIEEIVNAHPEIEMCAAFAIPAAEGNEDDIAVCVQFKSCRPVDWEVLDEWCRAKMPKFMWPTAWFEVAEIPRTPTNKIEKYKLRQQVRALRP